MSQRQRHLASTARLRPGETDVVLFAQFFHLVATNRTAIKITIFLSINGTTVFFKLKLL